MLPIELKIDINRTGNRAFKLYQSFRRLSTKYVTSCSGRKTIRENQVVTRDGLYDVHVAAGYAIQLNHYVFEAFWILRDGIEKGSRILNKSRVVLKYQTDTVL